MQSISALRDGDLEKVFENELAPQTQNHYFLDTYNKIRIDALKAKIDGFDGDQRLESVKGTLLEALQAMVCVGSSNAEQVVCLPLSPIDPYPYRPWPLPMLSFSQPVHILMA